MIQFTKAVKAGSKLRMAITGPSGSGKTYTALLLARGMAGEDGRICVLDTERGSARKYADEFNFDVFEADTYSPQLYIDVINAAEKEGYDVLVLDSLSHAWVGKGGALEMVDREAAKSRNSFAAWGTVTPIWQEFLDKILSARVHIIGTLRSKMEYIIEESQGKKIPRKVGLAPIFREGGEYEFDVVGDMSHDHRMVISKTRCRLLDGAVINHPDEELAETLREWLEGESDTSDLVAQVDREGAEVYGDKLWPAKCDELTGTLRGGKPTPLTDLRAGELQRLLKGIRQRAAASPATAAK